MSDVLVLNRNYMAVHVTDWRKAFSLLYTGHARAIDEDLRLYSFEDWKELSQMITEHPNGFVNTVSLKLAIPEIIILSFYDRLPKVDIRFTRSNIYKNYGLKCCYCGKKFQSVDLNLDHVLPRSRGGTTTWNNIVLSCIPCNMQKADRTPVEAGFKMHYQPLKPNWKPLYAVKMNTGLIAKKSWQKFIDICYWHSELED
jgi:5-methylcytosine-specific restriction endonuclease McrA